MSGKRKRTDLNVQQRIEIGTASRNMTIGAVMMQFDVSKPTVITCKKRLEEFKEQLLDGASLKAKRMRLGKAPELEAILLDFIKKGRSGNFSLQRELLVSKAQEIAAELAKENPAYKEFKATVGWMTRFLKRSNLKSTALHGEGRSADVESGKDWLQKVWPLIASDFPCERIFNMDETALFYRAQQNR